MHATQNILKAHKLRNTSFRQQVIELFQQSEATLSLKDLEKGLGEHDRVTLYRTLKAFEDHGIIHKVPTEDAQVFYGLCRDHCSPKEHMHDHAHFSCRVCQNVFCVDLASYELPRQSLDGFTVEHTEILLEGICAECTKKDRA
jgi:Fur family ferric uptake transcriptional regulator